MLLRILKPAGILIIILAGFFVFNTISHASLNNVISFGDMNSFSNPANLCTISGSELSMNHYQSISNNAIPAIQFFSNFNGPYFNGNRVDLWLTRNSELNYWHNNWGFGFNLLEEAHSVSGGDSVRLMQDFKDNSHTVGKIYDIAASGQQETKAYLKFYYSTPVEIEAVEDLRIGATFNIINGLSYGKVTVTGQASVESATTTGFDVDFNTDYNTKDTHGNGYGLDLGASCRVNDRLSLDLILENVLGEIYWQNVRNMEASGDTGTAVVDGDGNITNNPTLSGTEITKNLTERLAFKSILAAKYRYSEDLSLLGMIEPYQDLTYYYLGSKWSPSDVYNIDIGYGSRYDSASVGIEFPVIKLTLFASDISLSSAKSLGILISGTVSE
ncbi:hypothetical protein ACFL4F_01040 [Candidatus Margulisiibacteriota bacterium]